MAVLIILEGPKAGHQFPLKGERMRIGREADADIALPSKLVSRNHAQIQCVGDEVFVEDLKSHNGTFLNGQFLRARTALTPTDRLAVGEYVLGLVRNPSTGPSGQHDFIIHEQMMATRANADLFAHDSAQKLQMVLEITEELGTTLAVRDLLDKLLASLLRLFPRADRGLVLLCEKDHLVLSAQRSRRPGDENFEYSRTIVKKSLADGVGILSEDARSDRRFDHAHSLLTSKVHSFLCVPLICKAGRRLGAIQLDRNSTGAPFMADDLRLLTILALQVAVVLDHTNLHAERIRQEVLRKELAVAREIQEGYLPTNFAAPPGAGYELFACITPAREVSGDLYDFFPLPDGRLAFLAGDVSGKGMPAALFMIAVRTLVRSLAPLGAPPAETLGRVNAALAADNPTSMFVTLAYGIFDPAADEIVLASGGHPAPLLVRPDGTVGEIDLPQGRLLGYGAGNFRLEDTRLKLAPGETLVFYSDGFTEAFAPNSDAMFDVDGLERVLRGCATVPLTEIAGRLRNAVQEFTGHGEIQDDQTLLLFRRV